ncbi:hypothetical protein C5N14_09970 [Micromonospora sp. MW-13]|nr:hypothetical protein C5N14_09970 [Micromonospora sp. MW-13]
MTDVGLHRAQRAGLGGGGSPVHLVQRGDLQGVAERGAAAVRLDEPDLAGGDLGGGERAGHGGGLPGRAGHREAGPVGAVVGDRPAGQHGVDPVPVGLGVGEPAQRDHAGPRAEAGAVGGLVEGPAPAVRGGHPAGGVPVPGPGHVDPAGQGDVALVVGEALGGDADRDQRAGAGALHGHRRPGQPEPVRHLAGQVVGGLPADQPGLPVVGVDVADDRRIVHEVEQEVPVGGAGRVDADQPGEPRRVVPGVLQGLPRGLQEQPVLRVGAGGLLRAEAEEVGVEVGHVVEPAGGPDVPGVAEQPWADAQGRQLLVGVVVDRVDPGAEVPPEGGQVRGAGEAAGHPHHRDLVAGVLAGGGGRGGRGRPDRGAAGYRRGVDEAGLRLDRGILEQPQQGRAHPEPLGEPLLDHAEQQRLAADVEEAGGTGDRRSAQHRAPDVVHGPLGGGGRLLPRRDVPGRVGQRALVDLAGDGERELVHHHDGPGQRVLRQPPGEGDAQGRRVEGPAGRPGVREQLAVAGDGADRADAGLGGEDGFDLGQLDPEPAHLDLPVEAAEADQSAAGQPRAEVTGPVRPDPVRLAGEPVVGPVEVAGGDVPAADHDLAGVAGEVHLVAGKGGADRQRAGGGGVDVGQRQRVPGGERHLGRAVAVDQDAVGGEPVPPPGGVGAGGLLAAEQHRPDGGQPPVAEGVEQEPVHRGGGVVDGDPVPDELVDGVGQAVPTQVDRDDGGAGEQRRVQVGDGRVEAERGEQAEPVVRADGQGGDLVVDHVGEVAVGLPDRLRQPGRAGGEQHVRQRVRVDRGRAQRRGGHRVGGQHGGARAVGGEPVGQFPVLRGGQHGVHVGGGEHVPQPVDGKAGIQRHVRAAGGERAEERRDGRRAVRGEQGDPVAGAGVCGGEQRGVPPGGGGEVGVADRTRPAEQGGPLGNRGRQVGETMDDRVRFHVSRGEAAHRRQARSIG